MSKTFDIVQYVNEHRQVPFPFVDSAKLGIKKKAAEEIFRRRRVSESLA